MESESLQMTPVFPPELEELIFSFAFQENLKPAGRFCLIAKRVRQWMLPYIYKIMIFDKSIQVPHRNISFEDLPKHGAYVRHLLLQNPPHSQDELALYISECPNLISLALWIGADPYGYKLIDAIHSLQLKYLSFDITAMTKSLAEGGSLRPLPAPFHSVTHLELVGVDKIDIQDIKTYFPAITHLAITARSATPVSALKDVIALFQRQLRVVIWYDSNYSGQEEPSLDPDSACMTLDEQKVVGLDYGRDFIWTWYEGVSGGLGIWRVAEEAVEARHSGAVRIE